jgi:hypothetical protein
MTVTTRTRRGVGVGGAAFLIVALLMAAMAAYIIFVPVDATNFETTTGLDWAEFSSSNPDVAEYLTREARLLAIGFLGLSLLSAAVAWREFHQDDRSTSRALWLFPAALLGAGIVFLTGDGVALGSTYLVAGAAAAVGLILAERRKRTT